VTGASAGLGSARRTGGLRAASKGEAQGAARRLPLASAGFVIRASQDLRPTCLQGAPGALQGKGMDCAGKGCTGQQEKPSVHVS